MAKKCRIVRDVIGRRYLLTARRIVEMDSSDAKNGVPWAVFNEDIKQEYKRYTLSKSSCIPCHGMVSRTDRRKLLINIQFGPLSLSAKDNYPSRHGCLRIGCGFFDVLNFQRILKNAGCKVTRYALAAKAGAEQCKF